jgi:ubiquinone/menaquinone biosynthesis C-methylase UbiE
MTDPYASIGDADGATQERLAAILELRAADQQQRAIVDDYLADLEISPSTRALDVGCGTGFVTRAVAKLPGVAGVVGVDPSPVFIAKARELSAAQGNVEFHEADARALPFADRDFDVVLFHTTLTHVPRPERALSEAFRVLKAGGRIVVCDGDYSTITVANGDWDPLQACIEAAKTAFINDVWVTRRMPLLLRSAGFHSVRTKSHGYLQVAQSEYIASLVDRGADTLATTRRIGPDLSASLKAEFRRRVEAGEFFGFIGFVSFQAHKPV